MVDCEDGRRAANFYSMLLGWPITMEDNGWVLLRDDRIEALGEGCPVWPEEPGKPMKMLHLDFQVDDLKAAEAHALACGAVKSPQQFLEDQGVIVFFDTEGHPFCLYLD